MSTQTRLPRCSHTPIGCRSGAVRAQRFDINNNNSNSESSRESSTESAAINPNKCVGDLSADGTSPGTAWLLCLLSALLLFLFCCCCCCCCCPCVRHFCIKCMTFVVGSQLKREGCRRLPHGRAGPGQARLGEGRADTHTHT